MRVMKSRRICGAESSHWYPRLYALVRVLNDGFMLVCLIALGSSGVRVMRRTVRHR